MKLKLSDDLRFLQYLVCTIILIGSFGFLIYSIWIQEISAIIFCTIFSAFLFFFRKKLKN
ncbi:hypothetical protein IW18_20275 [Flavobacterium hibernum]|uniref:Uncharacterized protein n=1 Tax=Flavobacterium hibernum TaxID=37752 RepID=A0A0D0EVS6_9FLAO|nr:hypothetical protein IW18_20275 [Flavobacterium hibernum]